MNQTKSIHLALKKVMKSQGHTYADAAITLGLSLASIKRLFSQNALSLTRLEALCDWLRVDVQELVRMSARQAPMVTMLTAQQEVELRSDTGTLLLAYLLLNHWKPEEILQEFDFSEAEMTRRMFILEKLGMVEVLPFDRVKLKTARNFSWRKGGPIQKFFEEHILSEFLASSFNTGGEHLRFVGGMLTRKSILHLHKRIEDIAREFDELVESELTLPVERRHGTSMLMGIRPWEYSGFSKLRRRTQTKPFV